MNNISKVRKDLAGKHVTLDCNVLLLLVVGSLDRKHIGRFKRTRIFVETDFELLASLISKSHLILTPNVFSEASNLLESYNFNKQKYGLKLLKTFIKAYEEHYSPSKKLIENGAFMKFGLSDSSIEDLCLNGVFAITVDLPLYGYLYGKSMPVINFNHLRQF
jgi:hypothetical protein